MRENCQDFLMHECNAHICCLNFMTSNPRILQVCSSSIAVVAAVSNCNSKTAMAKIRAQPEEGVWGWWFSWGGAWLESAGMDGVRQR
jgi:hypothetical protein